MANPKDYTDRWILIAGKDSGDDIVPTPADDDMKGIAVIQYVWDTDTLAWVKMEQPVIEAGDLYVAVDDLEEYTLDQLLQYKMSDYDDDSGTVYIGYVDKDGNWFIKKVDTSNGQVRYVAGTSGYATAWSNRTSQSYDYFYNEF